ncbi:synaptic vesicle glycoprotein 2B-like [Cylas formicarius]|uniref:synaptic vesicle glycoprotein 2B-like n=1 Tax=Cylas formicarius TaxID=197179 RepID=UPI0029587769|nr:synaptic vesicle glycoprotein 2B-like [Cylas formicarius]
MSEVGIVDSRKLSTSSSLQRQCAKVSENEPATFEEAISATRFGKFNWLLAFVCVPASFCIVFDTTSMSYTSVAAQCDLDLDLNDKGLLNAVTYAGMVSSAAIWGFLFDVLGRKRLIFVGFLADGLFVLVSAFAQDLMLILAAKFFQGFIVIGPFSALSSYISEFHCARYRPAFQLLIGCCNSFGTVLLPLIAWALLPQDLDFSVIGLDFHSWNVFLFVTAVPALLNAAIFAFLPESPKFLMMCGENEKALKVFETVYRVNTGLPADTFPVKRLVDETKLNENAQHGGKVTAHRTKAQALKEGFQQIRPLFFPPHLFRMMLVCVVTLCIASSVNMLRLWLPQIFQAMTDYEKLQESADLCTMMESIVPINRTVESCVVNTDNQRVYINSMIVGCTSIVGYGITVFLMRIVGKRNVLVAAATISGAAAISMYFAQNSDMALAFSAVFNAMGALSANVVISVTVDLFPTTLRTLAISIGAMSGRAGAMSGSFIFPFLIQSGCLPPFLAVGGLLLSAACLSMFFPKTDMQALQ